MLDTARAHTGGLHPRRALTLRTTRENYLTPVHSLSVLVIHFCRKISERNLPVNLVVFNELEVCWIARTDTSFGALLFEM